MHLLVDGPQVIAIRPPAEHLARRRNWARAFTAGSVKDMHPKIVKRTAQLMDILEREAQKPSVDIAKWIGYFTFDVMGDFV